MKHNHHDDNLRSAVKRARSESSHPTARAVSSAGDFDDSQPEGRTPPPAGNGQGLETLSDRQRLELQQASERNKDFLNPIQSFWPTPSE
jgi:hypothetical protein